MQEESAPSSAAVQPLDTGAAVSAAAGDDPEPSVRRVFALDVIRRFTHKLKERMASKQRQEPQVTMNGDYAPSPAESKPRRKKPLNFKTQSAAMAVPLPHELPPPTTIAGVAARRNSLARSAALASERSSQPSCRTWRSSSASSNGVKPLRTTKSPGSVSNRSGSVSNRSMLTGLSSNRQMSNRSSSVQMSNRSVSYRASSASPPSRGARNGYVPLETLHECEA